MEEGAVEGSHDVAQRLRGVQDGLGNLSVADLWRDHTGKVTLIEINLYGLSDPGLFSYEELETAGGEFGVNSLVAA